MIFIIGANGFLGQGFVKYCENNKLEFLKITRENYKDFIGKECDILINANGNSKKFLANVEPQFEFDATVKSVMASLHDIRYKMYIMCSTCDVYNDVSCPAHNDEKAFIDIYKQSRYGFHKYIAEQFVCFEAKEYLICRFGGFVGEGLKKNPIFDIINELPLWLDPESKLQFIDKDEAINAVFKLLDLGLHNEVINICGNGLICLKDVMQLAQTRSKVKPDSPKVLYDININKLLSYIPIQTSQEVVKKFVNKNLKKG